MFHTIGFGFKSTSKKGTEYIRLNLFPTQNEDNVSVLGFTKKSKKGNDYYDIVVSEETAKEDIQKLRDLLDRHLVAKFGNEDNTKLVENMNF